MKINNKDLQFIYKDHIIEEAPLLQKVCPNPKELIKFFRAKLSKRRVDKILDHITNCPYCAKEVESILLILREEKKLIEETGKIVQFETDRAVLGKTFNNIYVSKIKSIKTVLLSRMWKYAFILFGVTIFLSIFIIFKSSEKIDFRGEGPYNLRLIEPKESQSSRIPLLFKWNKVRDSDYYVLELFDETLYPVWKSNNILENRIFLPKEIAKNTKKNRIYFWMVTAFLPDGKKVESNMGEFKLID